MKESYLFLLVLLFFGIVTANYSMKIHKEDDAIDKIERGLSDIKKHLPNGAKITYRHIDVDVETGFRAKFALAPDYISTHKKIADTTLTICSLKTADSVLTHVLKDEKIITKNTDERYAYLLSYK